MKNSKNQRIGNRALPKSKLIITAVLFFLGVLSNAYGQNNLNITFRPGANFPLNDLGTTELSHGAGGFETTIAYRFIPNLQVYGGWGSNWFSESESKDDSGLRFVETGYSFGLQFIHPMSSESKLNYMIGGGGIFNHIETENEDGDLIDDTEHGVGWQVDAGLLIPIGHHNRWQIMPTVRYHALSREVTSNGINSTLDLNYFSVGVGVIWTVWRAN